jgi:membrane protein YdbS with pleckstrin-like domain
MGPAGLIVGLLMNLIWIIPAIVIVVRYYQSLHYEIHEDEVIMHVGVITKTVKHVPFRTITNLKVKRGPFDRLFGLGTVDIQTAGKSGENGAEESLVGLSDVREVYNQITSKLRSIKQLEIYSQNDDKSIIEHKFRIETIELLQQIRNLIDRKI